MRLPIQILVPVFRNDNGTIEFLLLKRVPEKGGFWQASVSGGYEESDATLLECCYREVEEEIGISKNNVIRVLEKVYIHQFSQTIPHKEQTAYKNLEGNELTLTDFVFGFEVDQAIKPVILQEHTEYQWLSINEAKALLTHESSKLALDAVIRAL